MGYDDTLRDQPRVWASLVTRHQTKVQFTHDDIRRLERWDAALRGPHGDATYRHFIQEKGVVLAELVFRFVYKKEGLEVVEALLGWPARSGRLVLRLLLDDLVARHVLG